MSGSVDAIKLLYLVWDPYGNMKAEKKNVRPMRSTSVAIKLKVLPGKNKLNRVKVH